MRCGILVQVKNGRAVNIERIADTEYRDPCSKLAASLERLYHPQRLLFPQRRTGKRGSGKWERITWDEALSEIAGKLIDAREKYGSESVSLVKGFYSRHADFVSRFGNVFGTPNVASIDNTCYVPSATGRLMTYGFDGVPDLGSSPDCVMCWGSSANPPMKEGSKLIVVNVFRTAAAKKADMWLQPRPATDLALALGMLNVIVNEKLYDRDFINSWTTGFDKLEAHIQQYSPERVAAITWVPAKDIVKATRLFTSYRYACLMTGNASEDTYNSTQFARAIAIIQAICGLLDIPGGTIETEGVIKGEATSDDVLRRELSVKEESKKLGSERGYLPPSELWYSIASKPLEIHPQHLISTILEEKPYPIKAVGIMGSNPLLTWSNSRRVYDAFMNVPFLFVSDLIMTPTAALADIVLPVASYLETDGVVLSNLGSGVTSIQAQQKAVEVGECLPTQEIIIRLADKLGLSRYFWENINAYLDAYLAPVGITFSELRQRSKIIISVTRYRKYLRKGFNTPSGKVEIHSSLCSKWGYEPLPVYHEPEETPISSPHLSNEYPLILASFHEPDYNHSQDRHLATFRKEKNEPEVLIHPDTATKFNIADGDMVYIESKRGRIKQRAVLSTDLMPQVIYVGYAWWFPEKGISNMYGWDEANINILTDDSPPYSPEMGSPKMRGFLCKIYKA
ncbi:MAG: molybdopterin-dependent oxidoreductase [Dehalococcoidales bacterium]|nr:molybdopterin-dependent oxidoreductase [Dehalococcoidales bacterium]